MTSLEICKLYENGLTIDQIWKLSNIRVRVIKKIIIDAGIMRNRSSSKQKYNINENYFNIINTEEKAYFLGFLYADGYNNTKTNTVRLTLHNKDTAILEKLNSFIFENRPLTFYKSKVRDSVYTMLTITNKKISNQLNLLGCGQAKTFTLTFPTEEQVPSYLHSHFIRGYFDGDGSISNCLDKRKNSYNSTISFTSTEVFLTAIKDIFSKEIGCKDVKLHITHKKRNNNIRMLFYGGNVQCKKIGSWLYKDSTIYLERKKDKIDKIGVII